MLSSLVGKLVDRIFNPQPRPYFVHPTVLPPGQTNSPSIFGTVPGGFNPGGLPSISGATPSATAIPPQIKIDKIEQHNHFHNYAPPAPQATPTPHPSASAANQENMQSQRCSPGTSQQQQQQNFPGKQLLAGKVCPTRNTVFAPMPQFSQDNPTSKMLQHLLNMSNPTQVGASREENKEKRKPRSSLDQAKQPQVEDEQASGLILELTDKMQSDEELGWELMSTLNSGKKKLIDRIIEVLGQLKTNDIYELTKQIQCEGGIYYQDDHRFFTPEEVFYHIVMLKSSPSECQMIFAEDSVYKCCPIVAQYSSM